MTLIIGVFGDIPGPPGLIAGLLEHSDGAKGVGIGSHLPGGSPNFIIVQLCRSAVARG